jgi:hypothetical protein
MQQASGVNADDDVALRASLSTHTNWTRGRRVCFRVVV